MSVTMDSRTMISMVFIFLLFQVPKGGTVVHWWGNNVFKKSASCLLTCDWLAADWLVQALRLTPPGGIPVNP